MTTCDKHPGILILAGVWTAMTLFLTVPLLSHAAESSPAAVPAETDMAIPASGSPTPGESHTVKLSSNILVLTSGTSRQLRASIRPVPSDPYLFTWSSEDPSILEVSETGLARAFSPGFTKIVYTFVCGDEIVREHCTVSVVPAGNLHEIADSMDNWTWKAYYHAIANLRVRKKPWRNILCIGDSVTAGVQAGEAKNPWMPTYPATISALLNIPVYNHGRGGASIWSGGNYTVTDSLTEFPGIDAVFLMGGYNDWFYGEQCPLGDVNTPGTFTYDFQALCDRIAALYPAAEVYVVLPPTPHAHTGIEPYYDFSLLKAAEREVAEAHDFYVLNLPAEDILNGLEEDTWHAFFSDHVHLNDHGYLVLGSVIADKAMQARAAGR